METGPFDLQLEIRNYFSRLHQKASLTENDERELISHIQDGVEALEKKGLSAEEAFMVTIKRIGKMDMLSEEYNKVNPFFVSARQRSQLVAGLGLILSAGTVFLFLYELITMYRKAYVENTTVDNFIRPLLYFGLCIAVLMAFKWGRSFSLFLKQSIEQKPLLSCLVLLAIPALNFLSQPTLTNFFDKRAEQEGLKYRLYEGGNIQFVNLSFYLVVVSILFLVLVSFGSVSAKKKSSGKGTFFELPVVFLFLFGVVISISAAAMRYIPETNTDLQSSIFLAIVYVIGSFSIAFYNNENLWIKLFVFSAFGLWLGNLLVV